MRKVTIQDVADAAGVSRQTVSRAINNSPKINVLTRERVMETVRALGYRPSRAAQTMVTQRTGTVGLMVADITNPFFPELARGVIDVARRQDYNMILANSDDEPAQESKTLNSLAAQGVDGIIAFAYHLPNEELAHFADTFHPIVLINRNFEHQNVSQLSVDIRQGGEMAVAHLIEQGHQHIGMLVNQFLPPQLTRRLQGYKAGLEAHGIAFDKSLLAYAPPTLGGGRASAKQLLQSNPHITALFAYNDLMGLGAIQACRELERRVPEDCAIVGFDDIELAQIITPTLTSVHVDKREIGRIAMQRILAMIANPHQKFDPIVTNVHLIGRESTNST